LFLLTLVQIQIQIKIHDQQQQRGRGGKAGKAICLGEFSMCLCLPVPRLLQLFGLAFQNKHLAVDCILI